MDDSSIYSAKMNSTIAALASLRAVPAGSSLIWMDFPLAFLRSSGDAQADPDTVFTARSMIVGYAGPRRTQQVRDGAHGPRHRQHAEIDLSARYAGQAAGNRRQLNGYCDGFL